LLLATGSIPHQLAVSGGKEYTVTLRTPEDADLITALARPGASAAVIGSSFIAMEVASSLSQRKLGVTVISPEAVPFEKKLGKQIGEVFQRLHEQNRVRFELGSKVSRIEKRGDEREVILEDSRRFGAEVVVVGIGVRPATDYLQDLPRNDDGGISVDEFLQVPGKSRLFAVGDLAAFPLAHTGEIARIEHWRLAQEHGRLAAQNMFNQRTPYSGVPYFWTSHFNIRFDYVGYASSWEEIIVNGDLEKPDFIAFYIANGRAVAAIAAKRDTQAAAFLELLRRDRTPPAAALRSNSLDLVAWLHKSWSR
jgi:apoptosis-inducing factor 3